jgi:hypothetical protein
MDLQRLIPGYWTQTRRTFRPWDLALAEALSVYGVSDVSEHDCKVGRYTVWISNYPYAFGYNRGDALELLPTVATRRRLRRAIEQWHDEDYREGIERASPVDGAYPRGTVAKVAHALRFGTAGFAAIWLFGIAIFLAWLFFR